MEGEVGRGRVDGGGVGGGGGWVVVEVELEGEREGREGRRELDDCVPNRFFSAVLTKFHRISAQFRALLRKVLR